FFASLEQRIFHPPDVVAPAACGSDVSTPDPMITLDHIATAPLDSVRLPSMRLRWGEYKRSRDPGDNFATFLQRAFGRTLNWRGSFGARHAYPGRIRRG